MKNDAAFVFLPVGFLAQKVRKYPKKQLAGNKLILKINVTLFIRSLRTSTFMSRLPSSTLPQ